MESLPTEILAAMLAQLAIPELWRLRLASRFWLDACELAVSERLRCRYGPSQFSSHHQTTHQSWLEEALIVLDAHLPESVREERTVLNGVTVCGQASIPFMVQRIDPARKVIHLVPLQDQVTLHRIFHSGQWRPAFASASSGLKSERMWEVKGAVRLGERVVEPIRSTPSLTHLASLSSPSPSPTASSSVYPLDPMLTSLRPPSPTSNVSATSSTIPSELPASSDTASIFPFRSLDPPPPLQITTARPNNRPAVPPLHRPPRPPKMFTLIPRDMLDVDQPSATTEIVNYEMQLRIQVVDLGLATQGTPASRGLDPAPATMPHHHGSTTESTFPSNLALSAMARPPPIQTAFHPLSSTDPFMTSPTTAALAFRPLSLVISYSHLFSLFLDQQPPPTSAPQPTIPPISILPPHRISALMTAAGDAGLTWLPRYATFDVVLHWLASEGDDESNTDPARVVEYLIDYERARAHRQMIFSSGKRSPKQMRSGPGRLGERFVRRPCGGVVS
ncbi:hypothetical protein DFS34DRAFT_595128 [Phlyctochytrium arcticum]|nr:hypothetical protein DFS34DRAFT_595128 [Phlyctochytrium arcticum]